MSNPILTLLTAIIAALAGIGVLGAAWPRWARGSVGFGAAGLAGLAALLALAALLLDDPPATLVLPLGLPGAAFYLGLDPLAALFAVLLFAAGAATCTFAAATNEPSAAPNDPSASIGPVSAATAPSLIVIALIPACLAGLGLAVLAADSLTRGAGLAIAGGSIWAMGPADRAAAAQLGTALLAAAAVIAGADASPPAPLLAALLGPGALAGLLPLHVWLTPAHRASTPAAALLSGAIPPVAIYAILRMLFEHTTAAPPAWWGLPLLALGAASVLAGGLDATSRPEIDTALAAGTVRQTGLTAIGLGIALTARAADLPGVTTMALDAVLLLAALQAVCGTLLALAAGAIRHGAGTRRLDRLGGLVHRMPIATACLLTGLFGVAALPPSAGFAAIWLLFQSLLALPRAGGPPFQILLCALAAVLGLAAALASAALLRLVGVVCLGRPRTPRAAAADEPTRAARRPLLALATTTVLFGIFVGPLLRLLTNAPILALTGTGLGPRASLLGLAPGAESPGYAALPLASLLLLVAGIVLWLRRRSRIPTSTSSGPPWDDGFAAPPAWLPFGNPVTQTAGTGFAPALTSLPWRDHDGVPPIVAQAGTHATRIQAGAAMTGAAAAMPGATSVIPGAASAMTGATAGMPGASAGMPRASAGMPRATAEMTEGAAAMTGAAAGRMGEAGSTTGAAAWMTRAATWIPKATCNLLRPSRTALNAPAVALVVVAVLLALCAWAGAT